MHDEQSAVLDAWLDAQECAASLAASTAGYGPMCTTRLY